MNSEAQEIARRHVKECMDVIARVRRGEKTIGTASDEAFKRLLERAYPELPKDG